MKCKNLFTSQPSFLTSQGFTLAEVVIVIGIIGIIAQMTIPTLYVNTAKQVAVAKLTQAYSMLSQAIKMSEADNGAVSGWNFLGHYSVEENHKFYDLYLKPYLISPTFCSDGNAGGTSVDPKCGATVSEVGTNYQLNNGVGFSFVIASNKAYILIDTNASKEPNIMGKDVFYFILDSNSGIIPYGWVKGMTREQIINNGGEGCTSLNTTEEARLMCTALIMNDGWKMSSDYPWN